MDKMPRKVQKALETFLPIGSISVIVTDDGDWITFDSAVKFRRLNNKAQATLLLNAAEALRCEAELAYPTTGKGPDKKPIETPAKEHSK
jgi:hypothetical protein